MSKLKEKVSDKFNKQEHFNVQNWLELWSKDSVDNFVKNFISFQDKTTQVVKDQFVGRTKHYTDAYFAQKAIQFNADEDLPFKTLVLLGQKLNHPAFKSEIEKIINDNIIKVNGVYFKLNDLENQNKIKKAIENYQFEECRPIDKAA